MMGKSIFIEKIPAYFEDGKEGFERIMYGQDLLVRYFPDRLQILGFDTGEAPKGKGMDNWNVFVQKVPEVLKKGVLDDIRGRTGYKGRITFLQDDSRAFSREFQI